MYFLSVVPQCFHFTWIGPYENKSNLPKENCDSRVGDFNGIPCEMPLVATTNDTVPDVKALWQNSTLNREHYLCQMSPGYSCVKYSYIFKGGIQNITYMCAKVNSTNGCFRQRHSTGMQVEACVCTSKVGLIPCNVGSTKTTTTRNHILGLALAFYGVFNMFIIVK
ncbi:uncharacterized protein LOC133843402 isoform X2 [Drosophila sulfurigaster albostrigata]|uniref:uncharacterized protein LOC133843402 isoform X2 n=1 Tax=Drosophila sulfurigaster albostrigata TaxID=89887 RepID=UPI002D21E4A4|nr:uncharacterized protein LOC133843402 isoform X2 [Drosophila sulfurigaster albostrigata]